MLAVVVSAPMYSYTEAGFRMLNYWMEFPYVGNHCGQPRMPTTRIAWPASQLGVREGKPA